MRYACAQGDKEVPYDDDELSTREIAEDYASAYQPGDRTYWLTVYVYEKREDGGRGDMEWEKVTIHPEQPPCADGAHDWEQTWARGNGGGVIYGETCRKCKLQRVTNNWATDPDTGEQGLVSIHYLDQDGRVWSWED